MIIYIWNKITKVIIKHNIYKIQRRYLYVGHYQSNTKYIHSKTSGYKRKKKWKQPARWWWKTVTRVLFNKKTQNTDLDYSTVCCLKRCDSSLKSGGKKTNFKDASYLQKHHTVFYFMFCVCVFHIFFFVSSVCIFIFMLWQYPPCIHVRQNAITPT